MYGAEAVAVCDFGAAVMSGNIVRMCGLSGTWVGTEPVCQGTTRKIHFKCNFNSEKNTSILVLLLASHKNMKKKQEREVIHLNHIILDSSNKLCNL